MLPQETLASKEHIGLCWLEHLLERGKTNEYSVLVLVCESFLKLKVLFWSEFPDTGNMEMDFKMHLNLQIWNHFCWECMSLPWTDLPTGQAKDRKNLVNMQEKVTFGTTCPQNLFFNMCSTNG